MRIIRNIFIVIFLLAMSGSVFAGYNLFNGNDWRNISMYKTSLRNQRLIKLMYLQAVCEPTFYYNKKLIKDYMLNDYVYIIDRIYRNEKNVPYPLFFVVPMAEMIRYGDFKFMQGYVDKIIGRLKAIGMVPQ